MVDMDAGTHRMEIWFRPKGGGWKSLAVRLSTLADPREARKMMDAGLPADKKTLDTWLDYLTVWGRSTLAVAKTTALAGRRELDGAPVIVYPGGVWGPAGKLAGGKVEYAADATPATLERIAPLPGGTKDAAESVVDALLCCADPAITWTLAGWYAAAILSPLVRPIWDEFPQLNV